MHFVEHFNVCLFRRVLQAWFCCCCYCQCLSFIRPPLAPGPRCTGPRSRTFELLSLSIKSIRFSQTWSSQQAACHSPADKVLKLSFQLCTAETLSLVSISISISSIIIIVKLIIEIVMLIIIIVIFIIIRIVIKIILQIKSDCLLLNESFNFGLKCSRQDPHQSLWGKPRLWWWWWFGICQVKHTKWWWWQQWYDDK